MQNKYILSNWAFKYVTFKLQILKIKTAHPRQFCASPASVSLQDSLSFIVCGCTPTLCACKQCSSSF